MIFNFYAWIVADLDRMNVVLDTGNHCMCTGMPQ